MYSYCKDLSINFDGLVGLLLMKKFFVYVIIFLQVLKNDEETKDENDKSSPQSSPQSSPGSSQEFSQDSSQDSSQESSLESSPESSPEFTSKERYDTAEGERKDDYYSNSYPDQDITSE